jgi:hypothetical protein
MPSKKQKLFQWDFILVGETRAEFYSNFEKIVAYIGQLEFDKEPEQERTGKTEIFFSVFPVYSWLKKLEFF